VHNNILIEECCNILVGYLAFAKLNN